ncbi:MAG: alpha/beta hydrolase [Xanthomonadaceae bacterium]|nr:alpha/beta hydrolase [Xanthomonadaceae bacterium]
MNHISSFARLVVATLLIGSPLVLCADDVSSRRYLNQVFDDHVRTGDIVFAERTNDATGQLEKLTLRVFEPKGDTEAQRPLVILTPGGAFMRHEDFWMDDVGADLARAGYVVAINRYRLSKDIGSLPTFLNALAKAFSDQKAVIRFFVKDAAETNRFRIDPENIFIGGHSAGAITSMHVAYLDADDSVSELMTKALQQYGGIDGEGEPLPYSIRGVINLSGFVMHLDMIEKDEPPLISIHGDRDQVVAIGSTDTGLHGSIPIHEHASKAGLASELHVIRGAEHNDTADTRRCPECMPLAKRFMFNAMTKQ